MFFQEVNVGTHGKYINFFSLKLCLQSLGITTDTIILSLYESLLLLTVSCAQYLKVTEIQTE